MATTEPQVPTVIETPGKGHSVDTSQESSLSIGVPWRRQINNWTSIDRRNAKHLRPSTLLRTMQGDFTGFTKAVYCGLLWYSFQMGIKYLVAYGFL